MQNLNAKLFLGYICFAIWFPNMLLRIFFNEELHILQQRNNSSWLIIHKIKIVMETAFLESSFSKIIIRCIYFVVNFHATQNSSKQSFVLTRKCFFRSSLIMYSGNKDSYTGALILETSSNHIHALEKEDIDKVIPCFANDVPLISRIPEVHPIISQY